MSGVPFGQLDRSMRALTIGNVKGQDQRKLQRTLEGLEEREEQFKIAVAGLGSEFPSWSEVHLTFGVEFIDGSGQRNSPFDKPHFTYGVEIEQGGPIGLVACITRWDVGKSNQTIGCMLSIGAVATDRNRKFRGSLHARFQGYGAPAEVYGDPSQYDVE